MRGEVNVPVGGGPDILRAIYGRGLKEDGFLTNALVMVCTTLSLGMQMVSSVSKACISLGVPP